MANRRRRGPIQNRRHMARLERERLMTNYITIISLSLIGIVVLLVAYGYIVSAFIEPTQPVAIVNGDEISTREFQGLVRYQRSNLIGQWNNMLNFMEQFGGGGDPTTQSFFVDQLRSIESQLDPDTFGRTVLNNLVADRLIRQEAANRGITVTEAEIDKELETTFGFYDGGPPPTSTTIPTPFPTSTLNALQMTLTAPTATATPTTTVTITETAAISATATAAASGETEPTATATLPAGPTATPAEPTEEPTPSPTATLYTRDSFETEFKDSVDILKQELGFTEADLRRLVEGDLYRRKLLDAITAEVSQVQDQVWARQILVATEEEALSVIDRLNAGEDFAILAGEVSVDQNTSFDGGDMGWFSRGDYDYLDETAFSLEIGEISEPVQSQFGYHVLQLLGHEERMLSTNDYEDLKNQVFQDWLDQRRIEADIEFKDYWTERIPSDPIVPGGGIDAILQQQVQQQALTPQVATEQP